MEMEGFYQEMCDFQKENEEMFSLYENYIDTEIYEEIKGFLDIYKPEWRKNKELGSMAPGFILWVIGMWEYPEDESKTIEWLTNIYEEIDSAYERHKTYNLITRDDQLLKQFESENGSFYDGSYTDEEFDKLDEEFDKLFEEFKLKDGEEQYWVF